MTVYYIIPLMWWVLIMISFIILDLHRNIILLIVLVDSEGIIYEILDPNYDSSNLKIEKRLRVNELYQVDGLFTPVGSLLKDSCSVLPLR